MKFENADELKIYENISNLEQDFSITRAVVGWLWTKNTKHPTIGQIMSLTFDLFRAFVGIGVMSLHYSVSLIGPIVGIFGFISVALITL